MSFVSESFLKSLATVTRESADAEEYGVLKVDNQGTILLYNKYLSEFSGIDPASAEGRSYFTQIAPCTNNRLFYGKFKAGLAAGELDESFPYTFSYKMKPTAVDVHMVRDEASETNWVFVQKAE